MRLESVNHIVSTEYRKIEETRKKSTSVDQRDRVQKSDRTTLSKRSSDAVSSSETKAVEAHAKVAPDIRPDRIADVKSKIASGYYNSPEFADKLADKLIKDFGF